MNQCEQCLTRFIEQHSLKASNNEAKNQVQGAIERLENTMNAEIRAMKSTLRTKVGLDRFKHEIETRATVSEIGDLLDSKVDKGVVQKSIEKMKTSFSLDLSKKANKDKLEATTTRIDKEVWEWCHPFALAREQVSMESPILTSVDLLSSQIAELTKKAAATAKNLGANKADMKTVTLIREVLTEEVRGKAQITISCLTSVTTNTQPT